MGRGSLEQASCYFTREELRAMEQIAEKEERPRAKIVQFAVRVFEQLYKTDPDRAMEMAKASK